MILFNGFEIELKKSDFMDRRHQGPYNSWWEDQTEEQKEFLEDFQHVVDSILHNTPRGEAAKLENRFQELKDEFGNRCEFCGSGKDLQFAHIVPTGLMGQGRGKKKRYFNIRNHKNDYLLLCKNCHGKFDRHPEEKLNYYIDPEHIIKRLLQ